MASVRLLKWALLGLCLSAAGPALSDEYPYDIAKNHPAAMKKWRSVVPPDLKKQTWLTKFDGPASPISTVKLHGKDFLYGSSCITHDCGGNFIAFLIASDGSEAYGELSSETLRVKQRFFGAPDAETRELLDKKLKE